MQSGGPPGPMQRLGPRPLLLHLGLASPLASLWPGTAPPATGADPALLAGIAAYRRHPYRRRLPDPPAIWAEGSSRLLDYGLDGGRPLLVVPSLVNRTEVLDLMDQHSMLRFLAGQGMRPLLLDWGFPGDLERGFSLTDYVAGRLERAMAALGEPVDLLGYCMGGLMAVAAALRRPELVRRLVLLATPWDFWAPDPAPAQAVAALLPALESLLVLHGALPVDALQMLFSRLDPGGVAAKYRDFSRQDPAGFRALLFVAVEDWLADGVPLAAPVARETLAQWYGANAPACGEWRVLCEAVRPERLRIPCFVAIPERDRIVPPESAASLAALIEGACVLRPRAGHVGMVAGSHARTVLWERLAAWLHGQESGAERNAGARSTAATRG